MSFIAESVQKVSNEVVGIGGHSGVVATLLPSWLCATDVLQ